MSVRVGRPRARGTDKMPEREAGGLTKIVIKKKPNVVWFWFQTVFVINGLLLVSRVKGG